MEGSGAQPGNAKQYGNVVFDSVLEGEDEDLVIDTLPLPELHLLLGVMKLLFTIHCQIDKTKTKTKLMSHTP